MKILLLGDYSNCHRALATGLRHQGHEVTLISDGSAWMQCERDLDLTRHSGKLGGLHLFWKMLGPMHRYLRGYDIVALNDLNFVQLRPQRLRYIFDRLKRKNGAVFLTAMSTDIAYLDMVAAADSPLRYSEWHMGNEPSRWRKLNPDLWEKWHDPGLVDYQRYALDHIDGAVSVLYEYELGMRRALGAEKSGYGGIPIDTSAFNPIMLPEQPDKIKIFLGRDRTRMAMKGTDMLEEAAREVISRHPDRALLTIVENRPFAEFISLMRDSHVVMDQIYSYTPATTALMAMAYGLNVISGAEPEYYDYINEHHLRPIINAPTDMAGLIDTIEDVVLHPALIAERGSQSRQFVEKHNSCEVVARRFLDFWASRL